MPDSSTTKPPVGHHVDSSILGGLNAEELLARGMQSVKMTTAQGLASWEPPTLEEAARFFPNYEILSLIGRGGMGVVYKARQVALDRFVAIKLLPLEVSVDRDFAERFKREARTMAKMSHPNIVSVFDFGESPEGHLFFVMEFVEGTTLHQLIRTTGFKPAQALEIIVGVCEALQYAHGECVVHRDIKPANILVDVRGRVKVTDFGLARLSSSSAAEQAGYTMTGTVLGTPDYMAPEQKRGLHVDHRADIYSLGVMLYEMLCGNVPQGVFDLPSRLVSVDERVDQVVIRAMHQEPDRRYQHTSEMQDEVQTIRFAKDPHARAPQPRGLSTSGQRRRRRFSPALMVAVIAGVSLIVGALLYFRPGPEGNKRGAYIPDTQQGTAPAPGPSVPPESPAATKPPEPPPAVVAIPIATPVSTPPVAVPVNPPPTVAATPPAANPAIEAPVPRVVSPANTFPVINPEMAAAVAQVGSNPSPTLPDPNAPPPPPVERWRRLSQDAEDFIKKRDPDNALTAFNDAIEAAEAADPPAPALDVAKLCQRLGGLEASLGSTAEARGSLEHGKRLLMEARSGGKLGPDGTQVLGEIEGTLRRLPRD